MVAHLHGAQVVAGSNPAVPNKTFIDVEEKCVEKIWLNSYPPGVPAEINPDAYHSLAEIFDLSCKNYRDNAAFYNLGVTLTYRQIDEYSRDFAAYLQQVLKLKKGDRFAIMLPNTLQYPIALFGALRAGLVVVNVNPLYKPDELAHQMRDAGAETLLFLSLSAREVESALPQMPGLKNLIISNLGDVFPPLKRMLVNFALKYIHKKVPNYSLPQAHRFLDTLALGKKQAFSPPELTGQDIAFLQYTGGTTGVAKGAVLTHRNIISNIQQADAWFKERLKERREVLITALPLYHIFSLTANCLYFTKLGGLNVLITNPRDVPHMIKEMRKFKFSAITGVNTLFNALLKNSQFKTLDFSKLELSLGGGMAVQRAVALKWQEVTGVPLLEAYGLTETSPCVTINPINIKAYNGTIGLPVPSTEVCILDEKQQEVPIGETGELAVKGPQVMKGYWNNPSETAKVFTRDGWLLTGDNAVIDPHGYVRLLERKKDMILVSGFNVYPNEVEDVLAHIPGIREVAVIGIADEHSGETVKAFIVKDEDDQSLTEEVIIKYAKEHLTAYKVPKIIEFRHDLPKTNVGKIMRRALRVEEKERVKT